MKRDGQGDRETALGGSGAAGARRPERDTDEAQRAPRPGPAAAVAGAAALAVLAASVGPVAGQEAAHAGRALPFVVSSAWLADELGAPDLVVVQVARGEEPGEGIPGARAVVLDRLSPSGGADGLTLQMPPAAVVRAELEALGISDDSRVVVAFTGHGMAAATRALFVLDAAGMGDRSALLDGGLEGWKVAGHPVEPLAPAPVRGRLTRPFRDLVVSWEWVRDHARDADVRVLDARLRDFWSGARPDRDGEGHVPGAGSVPWDHLVAHEGEIMRFLPLETLRARLAEAGVGPDTRVVTYCHIGLLATIPLYAARMAGYEPRLYDGSMDEWSKLGLPRERAGTR